MPLCDPGHSATAARFLVCSMPGCLRRRRQAKQGAVMLKSIAAITIAAAIAAVITVFSAPTADVVASPLPKPAADAITACKQRAWPYLNCVGTEFGNPRIRMIDLSHATH